MDKNQLVGISLIFVIIIGWSIITSPSPEELAERQRLQDSVNMEQQLSLDSLRLAQSETSPAPTIDQVTDSTYLANLDVNFGDFAAYAKGEEKEYILENELMTLKLSSKGGYIKEAILKNYKKEVLGSDDQEIKIDLSLLEDVNNRFEYILSLSNKTISTADLFFQASKQGNTISFKVFAGTAYFEQIYTLIPDSYTLDYQVRMEGLNNILNRNGPGVQLNWINYLDRLEKNTDFEKFYSTIYYKEKDDDSNYCSCRKDDLDEREELSLEWFSHSNQFFNSTLMAKSGSFDGGTFKTKMAEDSDANLKMTQATVGIPYNFGSSEAFDMQLYIGPNEYGRLQAFGNDLEEVIPFGRSIFGTINRMVIRPFFDFLSRYISSTGIVIIVLIFIIKMLLYPLTYKMLYSQAKMGALKPELAHLKEKFKDEPQKQQMESMKIYREYGVSPFGGCMPMVMQMPIWYALFRFFPASITFRQESFLWAADLSSYDVFFQMPFEIPMFGSHISLFTLLWAVTTVLYTYYNTKHMDMAANPAMKYVQYFMPLMFLVFFNNYASGLTCYMFFSNLFNILQTVRTKALIFDEKKIKAELDEKKKIPKKKSKFQSRLEEAMKQQQQSQQQKGKRKKK